MSKIINYSLLSLFFVLVIFIALLYKQNGISMIVTMKTAQGHILNPKIYFSGEGQGLSEYNSRVSNEIKNNHYTFSIPDINSINTMRFDPTTKIIPDISIQNITIIRRNWFKILRYTIPLTQITSHRQIKDFKKSTKSIEFSTLGNDPQLNIDFKVKVLPKSYIIPLVTLLISLIIVMILAYLWHIYRKEEISESLITKLILYIVFFSFILFKTVYYKDNIRFGYPPDETMHLKYIQYVEKNDFEIVPSFEKMPHYLSHPPLYYQLLTLVYDENISTKENISQYRTLSMMLYLMALLLILYLGFSITMGTLGHLSYLTLITAIPMHSYLGGSITNDTLAILGAIIAVIGIKRLVEENYHTFSYFMIGFGGFLAYFSKLTAALLLFLALVFFLVRMIYTRKWIQINKKQVLLLLVFLIPVLYYQASIMLNYHALVPTYNHTHPEAYLKSGFFVVEEFRQNLSHTQWFERMLHYIQGGWFGIHSHHSFGHPTWIGVLGLVILHSIAVLALFLPSKKTQNSITNIGKITLLALFGVLIIQYFFSYKSHITSGYLGGLQPRYLLPFMFSFAIMASLFVERFKAYFFFNIFIIAICIHALYSDFFYFLQYYQ